MNINTAWELLTMDKFKLAEEMVNQDPDYQEEIKKIDAEIQRLQTKKEIAKEKCKYSKLIKINKIIQEAEDLFEKELQREIDEKWH